MADGMVEYGQRVSRDFATKPEDQSPIDWLAPGTPQESFVRQYVLDRLKYSEDRMASFYPRWRKNELLLQAYISLPDYEKILKGVHETRAAPGLDDGAVTINVPFAWAQVNTIVTYLLHMFAGRRPIFAVSTYRAEQMNRSKNMEMYLQYNADVVKFVRALYFFLMDGETYGLAVMRSLWKTQMRTKRVEQEPSADIAAIAQAVGQTATGEMVEEEYIAFEGNSCTNVDPYMFFPDPRVPMHEVAEKGEWVMWRAFMGKHQLLKDQSSGMLKWVDKVDAMSYGTDGNDTLGSARGIRALGQQSDSRFQDTRSGTIQPNYQVDQGTFEIIPKDLGLSDSTVPEKWFITVLNRKQIIQAQKAEMPDDKHPVVVAEPNSVGYSFGQLGTVDFVGPMQELMSWFLNSHIFNVRSALNNMFVVDPTKVEMQDMRNPKPGKLIRLKNTAFGLSDPKNAIQQLQVTDVTRSHINDFQLFGRLAGDMTGASDNVRGLQDAGGRKTATEIRTSSEAGTSRLAAKGKIYSAMALTDLTAKWSMNTQAYLSSEFEFAVLGEMGSNDSLKISPGSIQGDFYFPVHDGTLPMDKIGLLDVWKEIFMGVLQDPELRQNYDILSMFDWIAQLGGAQNIKSFRINVAPQGEMDKLAAGGGIPMDQASMGMALTQGAQGG